LWRRSCRRRISSAVEQRAKKQCNEPEGNENENPDIIPAIQNIVLTFFTALFLEASTFALNDFFDVEIDKENNRWLKINITPSFAYVMANNGDKKVVYNDPADGDPLPKMRHLGFSLYGDASINNSSIGSLRLTYQVSRDLAVDSLEYNIKHMGAELGFFDIVYLRLGKIDDEVGEIQSWSYGAGLNLGSALSWANIATGNAEGALEYMADHLDFWLEFAMYPDDEDEALSNTKFLKISLAI